MSRLPPPPSAPSPSEFGGGTPPPPAGGANGPSALAAPPQTPDPGAIQDVNDVMAIVTSARAISERHPQAVPIVQQINDLVQQLQMSIVQSLPPTEVAAPPV